FCRPTPHPSAKQCLSVHSIMIGAEKQARDRKIRKYLPAGGYLARPGAARQPLSGNRVAPPPGFPAIRFVIYFSERQFCAVRQMRFADRYHARPVRYAQE
ncbi:MAG: hypothetical protein LBO81_03910, partial [Clostridiales Family XIII bacterium]|nr:hypothetical protein [Clostridiales Family XIII bacterium]